MSSPSPGQSLKATGHSQGLPICSPAPQTPTRGCSYLGPLVLIHKVVVFFYLLIWPVGRHPQPVVELSTTGLGRRHISHYGCQARQVCYRNRGRHIFAKIIFILAQVSSPWQAYNLKAHLVLNNRRIQRPVTYTRMCTGWGREGRGFLKGRS